MRPHSARALCRVADEMVFLQAANHHWWQQLQHAADGQVNVIEMPIRLAQLPHCAALAQAVSDFCTSMQAQAEWRLAWACDEYQVLAERLGELILLEFVSSRDSANAAQEQILAQVGQLTGRLIHDFKNQMGGLKLYASYLQKQLAAHASDWSEGASITEKMVQSLNLMAENATQVGRLVRPLELRLATGDLAELLKQISAEVARTAAEQEITLAASAWETLPAVLPPVKFDAQLLRSALQTLLQRAVSVSPRGATVHCTAEALGQTLRLTIRDAGAALTEAQGAALFELTAMERLNPLALELAFARQVIAAHGGGVAVITDAKAQKRAGTQVQVTLPLLA